ncbi:MAG: Nramp family divalent metal transporter [Campylobacterota bacterium]
MHKEKMVRNKVAQTPEGFKKLKWYGPGLLWMLSAVGTGSILFTPRVSSAYQYELLWLLLIVCFFMWVMIKEMARFSVVTGETMLWGMSKLPGPKNWAVWTIFIPQLFAAAVGIAGLCAIVGSAFSSFFPGDAKLYAIGTLLLCVLVTATGHYMRIEQISKWMATLLLISVIISAVAVFDDPAAFSKGLIPSFPQDADLYIILPWIGTILAGSMGIVWFSYWISTRGFGGGFIKQQNEEPSKDAKNKRNRYLQKWLSIVDITAALGVIGGVVIITSFLILGSELLAPAGIMPSGNDVALDLSKIFSEVWGDSGRYIILLAIIVALGGSVLANQDGWGRSFADMTFLLFSHPLLKKYSFNKVKRFYIVLITGIIPFIIIVIFKDPVKIMSASGIIAAIHTPFIVITAIAVNRRFLPKQFAPSWFMYLMMGSSGLFYLGFAFLYLWDLF